jgi:hypothetical protein
VGSVKLEKYGKRFLEEIGRYCAQHGIKEIRTQKRKKR